MPLGVELKLYDIAPIPFYNADVEGVGRIPSQWSCSRQRSAPQLHY